LMFAHKLNHKRKSQMKRKYIIIALVIAVVVIGLAYRPSTSPKNPVSVSPAPSQPSQKNKTESNLVDQASSISVVVNKGRRLPSSYVPAALVVPSVKLSQSAASENMHLRSEASTALEQLFAGAANSGVKLMLVSGYRSYSTQVSVYNGYVNTIGQAAADASSARPGFSEHQTGLAADVGDANGVCQLDQCFETTTAGKWLAANSYKYGFIVRYPKGKDNLTGYEYEPWHIRFVGTDVAEKINESGQTLEQYFNLPTYPDYTATPFELHSD
jgi:D-alanyl-D-alanine carboxypeptidase